MENSKQLEKDLTKERSRYQSLLSAHLHLEELHKDLKEEMNLNTVRNVSFSIALHRHVMQQVLTDASKLHAHLSILPQEFLQSPDLFVYDF